MTRQFTSATTLDNLRKEAKRWLKDLRAHDEQARARLNRALPDAPAAPGLRDVQLALAREYGLPGWTALTSALAEYALANPRQAELVTWFIENACPDHHVRGGPDHVMARHTALIILNRHPEIARDSLCTAVICGELEEVERILFERPRAASEKISVTDAERAGSGDSGDRFKKKLGPKGWEPLLFLCFTRLPLSAVNDNAVAIARALLDQGADPNAFFMAGDSRYTPLVGVIGEGEESRPPHPQREALTRLLLERGADPYDVQVFYNLHFRGDVLWYLQLIHEQSVKSGREADWNNPEWPKLNMGGYASGARYLLGIAVAKNDLKLAEWCLTHGASPNAALPSHPNWSKRTLRDEALRHGLTEMADLLVRFGASTGTVELAGEDAFLRACLRLDREESRAILAGHPEYLLAPAPMFVAAEHDRADVATLLLDLGMSPDVQDAQGQRALHVAAYNDSVRVATLLLERGAAIDPVDSTHGATPLWFAVWGQRPLTIELLSRFSRDVWSLAFTGNVGRLRKVLHTEPQRARSAGDGQTPLMWLPGDEERAKEVVALFLEHGADPTVRNKDALTAADLAEKRGLQAAAELLRSGGASPGKGKDRTALVNSFLELACADPILANGPAAHARRAQAALRILQRHPEIARANLHTAVVCGDLAEVARILLERPEAASEPGGPLRRRHLPERETLWSPLLHLCYGRLPLAAARDNAVDVAHLLLDHGANPNDYFEVGSHPCRYTALCGVAGEGEDDAPPHPQKQALARLLMERGAEPYDIQLLYNTNFRGDMLWIAELIYEYSVKAGRHADWADPEWPMLGMGGFGNGARFFLGGAVSRGNSQLAEWCLAHGASPNSAPSTHPNMSKLTLYEEVVRQQKKHPDVGGYAEIAELLVKYGATPSGPVAREGLDAFAEASFWLDENAVRALLERHPEYLQSPEPIFEAAARDRADVVAFLLDLGVSVEIEDAARQRSLHVAAGHDALRVAELLIERGADTEAVESTWNNTPLGCAIYGNLTRMIELLSRFSRNVFQVVFVGNVERLRELLHTEPDLAKRVSGGSTPLMWLPDDDARAREAIELLLAHGADPSAKNAEGKTAAEIADGRGLYGATDLLRAAAGVAS
jgi:ankyrin repeat protein